MTRRSQVHNAKASGALLTALTMLALASPHVAAAAPGANMFRALQDNYSRGEAAVYAVQLRAFYLHLEHASKEEVLGHAQQLGHSCQEVSCDGLQPIALALADRMANLPDVSDDAAAEVLAPIFLSGHFPGQLARNFTLPIWSSGSLIVRNLRADAVQAMFERRGALVASGKGKVPMHTLLALGAMQLDFCGLDYIPEGADSAKLSDRERNRQATCERLALEGVSPASTEVPSQSTAPVIDAVSASMCASIEVQSSTDEHVMQRASELAQECFSTPQPGDKHSVSAIPGGGYEGWTPADYEITLSGDPGADGREWWEVRVSRLDGDYVIHAFANSDEMARLLENPRLLLVDSQQGDVPPHTVVAAKLEPPDPAPSDDTTSSDPSTKPADPENTAAAPATGTGAAAPAPDKGQGAQMPGGSEGNPGGEACEALADQLHQIGTAIKGSAPRVVDLTAGRAKDPTTVNPHPDSPWDQAGTVGSCDGWIDPQQGKMCNTPVMCNEGFQVSESCACEPDRQRAVVLELIGKRSQSECASMLCPLTGDCLCTASDKEHGRPVLGSPPDKGPGGDPIDERKP
jgi:hypothetical protein